MSKHGLAAQIIASSALGDIESTSLSYKKEEELNDAACHEHASCHNTKEV